MSDSRDVSSRECVRCSLSADLLTPQGRLCTSHAIEVAVKYDDWIPLIPRRAQLVSRIGPGDPTAEVS